MIDVSEVMESAKERGEAAVQTVAIVVDANAPEMDSMLRFERLVRHGYKFIDILVRKDGQEYSFQGDWLARLFREAGR